MPSHSSSISGVPFDDTGAFEVTDLGACSFLDDPQPRSADYSPRSLTDNLSACSVSAGGSGARDSCQPDPSPDTGCETTPAAESARVTAAEAAFKAARRRGTVTQIAGRPHHDSPPGRDVGMSQTRPALQTGHGHRQRRAPAVAEESAPGPRRSDRLDEALRDFVGDESDDVAPGRLEAIYGAVFDPEERAKELSRTSAERSASAIASASTESASFGWDDHELDAPIDPTEVRRRLGKRADGVPQFGIIRRPGKRADDEPERSD